MRRLLIVLLSLPIVLSGCFQLPGTNSQTVIDWVNFVQFKGIQYTADHIQAGRKLTKQDLGPEFAKVTHTLDGKIKDSNYQVKDGDAAFLDPGTPVYTVKGYTPQFRLAARLNGEIALYEVDSNPKAKTGSDLFDLNGKVEYIGVNSAENGITELAAIKDPTKVAALVDMVLKAPVVDNFSGPGDKRYFIAFHLKDGTAVDRSYTPGTGELSRGVKLPEPFRQAVEQALQAKDGRSDDGNQTADGNASGGDVKEPDTAGSSDSAVPQSPEEAKKAIADRAQEVLTALKNKDMQKLSGYVHPDQGVRFSPYSYVHVKEDLVFKAGQLPNLLDDNKEYTWGSFDGSGEPIKLTFAAYYDRFIYDRDFAQAKEIGYNQILGKGNMANNIKEVYPESIVVEYHFGGFDAKLEGQDWESLRLVFEKKGGEWYVVGINHDQWTI